MCKLSTESDSRKVQKPKDYQKKHRNPNFFRKIFANSRKGKKAPEIMISRRCVQSLNQIGQYESSENRRRKICQKKEKKKRDRVLGA